MSPKPFSSSQYDDPTPHQHYQCQGCYSWVPIGHVCEAREVTAWMRWNSIRNALIITTVTAACIIGIAWAWTGRADAHGPKPIQRPVGLVQAKHQCSRSTPLIECRAALRRALAAAAWQKHEVQRVLERTRGKQPFAYAAHLAELACHSFAADRSRCRPALEMLNVGRCESGLQRADPNPVSTALGWTQWLSGTWMRHPAGQRGWSRLDVLAMGIATEALVYQDGGWHEWSCGWAAS